MTYRYIYKITCTAGSFKGKFYYGQHTTENLEDEYKGSGRKIKDYYKKHPNDYVKEIISFHNSQEELNQAEYDIIKEWLNNPMCLNLKEGGGNNKLSEETKQKISKSRIGKSSWNKGKHGIYSEETLRHWSEVRKGRTSWNKGKSPSEETRHKLSESHKGKTMPPRSEETRKKMSIAMTGNKSLTGRIWVNNGIYNKPIYPEQLNEYIANGFVRGKIKKGAF